jgi:hypothetical protein
MALASRQEIMINNAAGKFFARKFCLLPTRPTATDMANEDHFLVNSTKLLRLFLVNGVPS